MTTVLSTKGQVILPQQLREQDKLQPGDDFTVQRLAPGRYMLDRIIRTRRATVVRRKGELPTIVSPRGSRTITQEMVQEAQEHMWEEMRK